MKEIQPRRMSKLEHLALIGGVVVASAAGIYLGYAMKKHDVLGHYAAHLDGTSYEKHKQEVEDRMVSNLFDKYDSNSDGFITIKEYKEEYRDTLGKK